MRYCILFIFSVLLYSTCSATHRVVTKFESKKGKLSWPVDNGVISDHFGIYHNPMAPGVQLENPGVDIQTTPNAQVRAVFEGCVSSVFCVDGKQLVMVQHGKYFTVYYGLASVFVSKGDIVSTLQPLGKVALNDNGMPSFSFQIWMDEGKKGAVKLNPEQWIDKDGGDFFGYKELSKNKIKNNHSRLPGHHNSHPTELNFLAFYPSTIPPPSSPSEGNERH